MAKCAEIKYKALESPVVNIGAPHPALDFSTYGWDYIQKIIQLQFDLPVCSPIQIQKMVESLVKEIPREGAGKVAAPSRFEARVKFALRVVRAMSERSVSLLVTLGALAGVLAILPDLGLQLTKALALPAFVRDVVVAVGLLSILVLIVIVGAGRLRELEARRSIDRQIRSRIAAGERDYSRVEDSIRRSSPAFQADPQMAGLLRERLQRHLEDESELQREAEDEVMRHLPAIPRHAKRLVNRLRLLLFIAHERKMFGGVPNLSPRHIAKWAVLCERWPELEQVVCDEPDIMMLLESPTKHKSAVRTRVPLYQDDDGLREFCLDEEVTLAPVMARIVEFAPA